MCHQTRLKGAPPALTSGRWSSETWWIAQVVSPLQQTLQGVRSTVRGEADGGICRSDPPKMALAHLRWPHPGRKWYAYPDAAQNTIRPSLQIVSLFVRLQFTKILR